jgi:hypothetical protein
MALSWDIFDQAALTGVVNRSLETALEGVTSVSESIAPRVDVDAREVKVQVRDVHAFGKGQYRAPGATLREEVIELAILSEMHRIKDEDYLSLQSSDENVRRKAGLSIVDRGNILAIRNRRLAESLKWEAFSGEAEITYPTGSTITVDYGIPASHKPTASTLWSDTANSDPIADIKEWATLTANAVGHYGLRIHLSSEVWELILENAEVATKLSGQGRSLLIPTEEDILALLRAGTEFVIVDEGYRDEGVGTNRGVDTLTPYLPKDKVLITTPYVIEGERIADTPTGQVLVSTGYNSVGVRQGPQAEVILEHISKTHFLRYESALIPRIHHPGAFVYATVT